MKYRKIKIVVFLIVALIIAFYMSGNEEIIPLEPETIDEDVSIVDDEPSEDIGTKEVIDKDDTSEENLADKGDEKNPEDKTLEEHEKQDNDRDKSSKDIEKKQSEEKQKIIDRDKDNKDKQDKYLTDPVPEGKPEPVEWQEVEKKNDKGKELKATLSVTCKTILNNIHLFNMDKIDVLPEDGIIYSEQEIIFYEGESVFDVLLREMQNNKIHMEFVMTPIYNSHYIEGINNIYEFDCGELSGWMYKVNGWFPNYGVSRYLVQDGDKIELIYTCDLGRDIGGQDAIIGGDGQ